MSFKSLVVSDGSGFTEDAFHLPPNNTKAIDGIITSGNTISSRVPTPDPEPEDEKIGRQPQLILFLDTRDTPSSARSSAPRASHPLGPGHPRPSARNSSASALSDCLRVWLHDTATHRTAVRYNGGDNMKIR